MRVLAVVPARGGSTRVPRKNLRLLGGKTLVRRALDTALAAGCFQAVALTSDDPEILAEANGLDILVLERSAALASDTARVYDTIVDALERAEAEHGRFDAVGIVQCTSPLTSADDLVGAIALFERSEAGSVVTVSRIESAQHPLKLKRLVGDRLLPYLEDDAMTPSHELPELWARNGSLYLTRRGELLAGNLIAEDVRGYEMPQERSLDIDTERDLVLAEIMLERAKVGS